jgi:SAM-dependent methyltransferase
MEMDEDAYYARVQSAYDGIALEYDNSVGKTAVSRRAKQLALQTVRHLTPPGGLLLDVGCYTGIEALLLAQYGFRVVGVDLSPAMIRIAEAKARQRRLQEQIRFEVLRASDIETLLRRGYGPFDTAYSVYGTLNLEPRIREFKTGILGLLKEGGYFVCGLLNPTVLYELVIAPWLLKFHGYRKLAKRGVRTRIGLGTETLAAFLYTPEDFVTLMEPEFRLLEVRGLHVLYPPPRGTRGSGLWWIPRALDSLELFIEARFPFSHLGFFSLLSFRKAD